MAGHQQGRIPPNIKHIGRRLVPFLAIAFAGVLLVAGIANGRAPASGQADTAAATAALNERFARGATLIGNLDGNSNSDSDGDKDSDGDSDSGEPKDDGENKKTHKDDGLRDELAAVGGKGGNGSSSEAPTDPQAKEILDEDFKLVEKFVEDRKDNQGNAPNGSFFNLCVINHTNQDNFIVSPGEVGAAQHIHQYFGNDTTNAFSKPENLLSDERSECKNEADPSAYWVPALLVNGDPVEPQIAAFIMRGYQEDVGEVAPMPRGLAMITGDAKATDPADSNAQFACSGSLDDRSKEFPDCDEGELLVRIQDFPSCWDGENLDSEKHREHVVFTEDGKCPEDHPVPLPRLRYVFAYDLGGADSGDLELSSFPEAEGRSISDHADFSNLLPTEQMFKGVQECINAGKNCGTLT
jgi:hypothetical protein